MHAVNRTAAIYSPEYVDGFSAHNQLLLLLVGYGDSIRATANQVGALNRLVDAAQAFCSRRTLKRVTRAYVRRCRARCAARPENDWVKYDEALTCAW